jgi:molybdate transport system substrate-binding protein
MTRTWTTFALGMAAALLHPAESRADVWLLSSLGIKPVIETLAPQFERATGHKVHVQYALTPQVPEMALMGEPFDVAIAGPKHIAEMAMLGSVAGGTNMDVARFGLGLGVREGAVRPEVGSPEALRRALLGAGSVGYVAAGSTGPLVLKMIERLGVAAEVKPKLKAGGVPDSLAAVASGATEAVVMPVPLIRAAKGVVLAGALPAEFQDHVVMTAGVSSFTPRRAAAEAFVQFLMSAQVEGVITGKGYERLAQRAAVR